MEEAKIKELIAAAINAREKAYAPYSGYKVGAAVLTEDGYVFSGCNIENASFGATNCAERTAIFKAVSEGHKAINAIAVIGSGDDVAYPCGICRQVIAEFAAPDLRVIVATSEENYTVYSLEEMLPHSFKIEPGCPGTTA